MGKNTLSDVHNRPEKQNFCTYLIKTADLLSDRLKVSILRCFVKLNSLEAEWVNLVMLWMIQTLFEYKKVGIK